MAKSRAVVVCTLLFLFVVGLVSCGGGEAPITHDFTIADEDFELRGCTWNLTLEKVETVIFEELEDKTFGVPYYPEQGFFYIVHVKINPGENPYLNLRDIRYQVVDVHGNIYLPVRSSLVHSEYAKQTGLKNLTKMRQLVDESVDGFVIIDGPGKLLGATLEIFNTGQTPEEKLVIVDLKQ
jgi:hypothetical protein